MKRTLLLIILILALVMPIGWLVRGSTLARQATLTTALGQKLTVRGLWNASSDDLVYTVAFSRQEQPNGPLVVYRASGAILQNAVPVIALARGPQVQTPLFFPSPDGRYVALLTPVYSNSGSAFHGASLSVLTTDGQSQTVIVPAGVATGDQVIWSADSQSLYYHSGEQELSYSVQTTKHVTGAISRAAQQPAQPALYNAPISGYDEIHRVDLRGHASIILRHSLDTSSLRLVGVDSSGALIATLARPQQAVALVRVAVNQGIGRSSAQVNVNAWSIIATLPEDILPGNVLRVGSDGASVECERVLSWHPLRYTVVRIGFTNTNTNGSIMNVAPLFNVSAFGRNVSALGRSRDGRVQVMSQVLSVRSDLAAQGISGVPFHEALLLADATSGATQTLQLPPGGQIVQTFWTPHIPASQMHVIPGSVLTGLLAFHRRLSGDEGQNASVFQQDEWMLEGHAGNLLDAPAFSSMCYGTCPNGATGAPHVSAAIVHGVAYVESNWHQFNTIDYRVNGEAPGTPVESWDGGWGEFQQTWGMPPQCVSAGNCRADAAKVQQEQSYNIGVGMQSLISAWNGTAGVTSSSDPNDPYKANHWFFAVWAYNGAYGNNPNDVASSAYGHWYPGAPFRSIYEEYVWYFAAHQQFTSNGWTDNYLPSLGPSLLPPQSDFIGTSDGFVACVTCTITDWTSGGFDRDWVGVGAPDGTTAGYFRTLYAQSGGEGVVGLPRDNGGSAAVHHWAAGWIQDFGGGSYLPGAFMLIAGTSTPYWVYGGVWTQYVTVDHAAVGCHGYPTSALVPYTNSGFGPDSYYRQSFQSGAIVWDATTHIIAADSCS